MADREKLVELLTEPVPITMGNVTVGEYQMPCYKAEGIADRLIANGVTFVTDIIVGGKCDYCQEDAEGYRKMIGAFSITNPFHGSVWQIETAHCKPRQIFFCPMCGRKLTEPPKGE